MRRNGTSAQHVWLDFFDNFRFENLDRARRCWFRPLLRRPGLRWWGLWRANLCRWGLRGRGLRFRSLLLLGSSLSRSPQEFFYVAGHVVGCL